MKKFVIALCLALFIAPISNASEISPLEGEAWQLELIGFSKDGAYVAFEQMKTNDGDRRAYAETSFVSVKNNRLEAEIPTYFEFEETSWADAKRSTPDLPALMKKYGIIPGNQGRFIGITPPHYETPISEFFALDRSYGLSIATKPAAYTGDRCTKPPQLLVVKLSVGGKTRDLQRDTRLPDSRECAYGYEMRSAHLYGRSLAVFVSYKTPAPFASGQGADIRWMVVTGML